MCPFAVSSGTWKPARRSRYRNRTMDVMAALAERKIQEAMERGEFDDLPGKGKPLDLSDDPMVPEELRIAYKVLKNAGYLPPELELHKEIVRLRDLVDAVEDGEEKRARMKELNVKLLRFNLLKKRPVNLEGVPEYRDRVLEKLAG
jgi:DnaJ homologue, subfamily C, member 28, conserved domain